MRRLVHGYAIAFDDRNDLGRVHANSGAHLCHIGCTLKAVRTGSCITHPHSQQRARVRYTVSSVVEGTHLAIAHQPMTHILGAPSVSITLQVRHSGIASSSVFSSTAIVLPGFVLVYGFRPPIDLSILFHF